MGNIIWLVIMIPTSMLFTGIGIYAWRRKKPMWFYSGSTVGENEIEDNAYNKGRDLYIDHRGPVIAFCSTGNYDDTDDRGGQT